MAKTDKELATAIVCAYIGARCAGPKEDRLIINRSTLEQMIGDAYAVLHAIPDDTPAK